MTVPGGPDAAAPGQHPSPWFRSAAGAAEGQVGPGAPAGEALGDAEVAPEPYPAAYDPPRDDETIGLRTADTLIVTDYGTFLGAGSSSAGAS